MQYVYMVAPLIGHLFGVAPFHTPRTPKSHKSKHVPTKSQETEDGAARLGCNKSWPTAVISLSDVRLLQADMFVTCCFDLHACSVRLQRYNVLYKDT